MSMTDGIAGLSKPIINGLEHLTPIADMLIRLWVAWVFYKSALTKGYWDLGEGFPFFHLNDLTFMLFENEYAVPFLEPELAAYLGTYTELLFPVLLALGLLGRFSAGVLFVFNAVAVLSYPDLNDAGKLQHVMWGMMLLFPLLRGPGKLSIDHLFRRVSLPTHPPMGGAAAAVVVGVLGAVAAALLVILKGIGWTIAICGIIACAAYVIFGRGRDRYDAPAGAG